MAPNKTLTPLQAIALEEEYLTPTFQPEVATEPAAAPAPQPVLPGVNYGVRADGSIQPFVTPSTEVEVPEDGIPQVPVNEITMKETTLPKVAPLTNPYAAAQNAQKRADAARQERDNAIQAMFDARKKALEKARTDDVRLASFNALGNVLRNLVQPLGWGVGGATAGVQPYDNRQYIEAFNRAVKAGDDIRNIGLQEDQLRLNYADRDAQQAQNEATYQRRRGESQAEYFARLDAKAKIEGAKTYQVLLEKRREKAVDAFYTERARRISHKEPLISFRDFIDLEGLGKQYYGDWMPSEKQVQEIEDNAPGKTEAKATETPAVKTETQTGTNTRTETKTQTGTKTQTKGKAKDKKTPAASAPVASTPHFERVQGYTPAAPRGALGRRMARKQAAAQGGATPAASAPVASTSAAAAKEDPNKKWGGKAK